MLGNGYPLGGFGRNPLSIVPSIGAFSLTAGAAGVTWERFGWMNPETGQVSNLWGGDGFILGYVLAQPERYGRNGWLFAYWNAPQSPPINAGMVLRAGQFVTLANQGDFWTCFPDGCYPGQQVFASTSDGSAKTGVAGPEWTADSLVTADSTVYTADGGGYRATPWTAMTQAQPGQRALISSWAKPF